MNRFEYAQAVLREDESFVVKHKSMKLYHGHQKVGEYLIIDCDEMRKTFTSFHSCRRISKTVKSC